jgi:hypothetical protein
MVELINTMAQVVKLFDDVESQVIDSRGKTIALNYNIRSDGLIPGRINLTLFTSPLPPYNVDEDRSGKVYSVSIGDALTFINNRGLVLESQDGVVESIQGLWVKPRDDMPGIYYGYIPIIEHVSLKNVPFSEPTRNDPYRTDPESELTQYRDQVRLAEILKEYVLFTYALDPDNFDESSIVVIPKYKYDLRLLSKRLYKDGNNVMYSGGKLIASSDELKQKLLSYLEVQVFNDVNGVKAMKNKKTLVNYYQSISDFRNVPGQIIFTNLDGLNKWRGRDRKDIEVMTETNVTTREPYFFKTKKIANDALFIIQNVKDGDLERAIYVGRKWHEDHTNTGFDSPKDDKNNSYTLYNAGAGEKEIVKRGTNVAIPIFQYSNKNYAAILFLNRGQRQGKCT